MTESRTFSEFVENCAVAQLLHCYTLQWFSLVNCMFHRCRQCCATVALYIYITAVLPASVLSNYCTAGVSVEQLLHYRRQCCATVALYIYI